MLSVHYRKDHRKAFVINMYNTTFKILVNRVCLDIFSEHLKHLLGMINKTAIHEINETLMNMQPMQSDQQPRRSNRNRKATFKMLEYEYRSTDSEKKPHDTTEQQKIDNTRNNQYCRTIESNTEHQSNRSTNDYPPISTITKQGDNNSTRQDARQQNLDPPMPDAVEQPRDLCSVNMHNDSTRPKTRATTTTTITEHIPPTLHIKQVHSKHKNAEADRCGNCNKTVTTQGVFCDQCNTWLHYGCENLTDHDICKTENSNNAHVCNSCNTLSPYTSAITVIRPMERLTMNATQ